MWHNMKSTGTLSCFSWRAHTAYKSIALSCLRSAWWLLNYHSDLTTLHILCSQTPSRWIHPIAYHLLLIHVAALLRNMENMNFKKAQKQYEKNYDNHGRFEPRFAAGDHVFIKRPTPIAHTADRMAHGGYSKLLPHHRGPYWIITVGPEYAKIDQDGALDTVSIYRSIRAAEEERPKMKHTSD